MLSFCTLAGGEQRHRGAFPSLRSPVSKATESKHQPHAMLKSRKRRNPSAGLPSRSICQNLTPFFLTCVDTTCSYGDLQEASSTEHLTHTEREGPSDFQSAGRQWVYSCGCRLPRRLCPGPGGACVGGMFALRTAV